MIDDSDDGRRSIRAGWRTIATVGPEGICKEDACMHRGEGEELRADRFRVRGVIGSAGVVRPQQKNGGSREDVLWKRGRPGRTAHTRPGRPRLHRTRRGLSLIEVLLALTIFMLALVVLARLVDMGADRELEARYQTRGIRLALDKLGRVRGRNAIVGGASGTIRRRRRQRLVVGQRSRRSRARPTCTSSPSRNARPQGPHVTVTCRR